MSGAPPLLSRRDAGILWLTLDRPEARNALTVGLLEALERALSDAAKDARVRAVALTGAGKAFCAGQDLKELLERKPPFVEHLRRRYNPLILRLRRLDKPVLAAVNGVAAGAGLSLALACDFRLLAAEAELHSSFSKLALVPDSGHLFWLSRLAGPARALELATTGRALGAQEALAWGLADRVVPAEKLLDEAAAFLKPLVEGSCASFALTKRLLDRAVFAKDLESLLDEEALAQEVAGRGRDHQEGLAAFIEKRPPDFGVRH